MKRIFTIFLAMFFILSSGYAFPETMNHVGTGDASVPEPRPSGLSTKADSLSIAAVRSRMDEIRKKRPTVAVVLSGGGAKGAAQIGVLKYLESIDMPIDMILGTSMGGLVGGFYALGYNAHQMDSIIRTIDWNMVMSDAVPREYISYAESKYKEKYLISIPFYYDTEYYKEMLEDEMKYVDTKRHEEQIQLGADAGRSVDLIRDNLLGSLPSGYYFGQNVGNKKPGAWEASQTNPESKWETSLKQNYGIDFNILKDRLSVSVDYFIERRKDILTKPDYLPGILGMVLPPVNVGEVENKGYELQLKWNDQLSEDFRYWATFNMSYATNKIVYMNEVKQNEPWLYETGRRINSRLMYKFWGFYDETADARYQEEFGRPIADHGITLAPGDAVYVDLNGDGVNDCIVTADPNNKSPLKILFIDGASEAGHKLSEGTKGNILPATAIERKWHDYKYLKPIPTTARQENPNLSQNPGW